MAFPTALTGAVANVTALQAVHLNNVETKIGIDDSAVGQSLDYQLKKRGVVVGATGYEDLATAVAALNVSADYPILFVPAGNHAVDADLSSDDDYLVYALPGANIQVANTKTFSPGLFHAGRHQVFTLTGTGAIAGLVESWPEWFGAVADGVTDNYNAIAAAYAATTGNVYISKSLLGFGTGTALSLPRTVNLIGFGATDFSYADTVPASKLKWVGAANGTMVQGSGATNEENQIKDIAFIGDSTADHAIDTANLRGVKVTDCFFDGFLEEPITMTAANYFGYIARNRTARIADQKGFFNSGGFSCNGYVFNSNNIKLGPDAENGTNTGGYGFNVYGNGLTLVGNKVEGKTTNYPTAGGRKGIIIRSGSKKVIAIGNRIEMSWITGQTACYGIDVQTAYPILGPGLNDIFTTLDGSPADSYQYLFSHASGGFSSLDAGGYYLNPWCLDVFPRPDAPAIQSGRIAGSDGTADGTFGAKGSGLYVYGDATNGWYKMAPVQMVIDNSDHAVTGTTDLTTLKSVTFPAGMLGINRGFKLYIRGTKTGAAGNKTVTVSWHGTIYTIIPAANDTNDWEAEMEVWNTSASAQRISWKGRDATTNIGDPYSTAAVDTSGAVSLAVKGQLVDGADSITLTMFRLELF